MDSGQYWTVKYEDFYAYRVYVRIRYARNFAKTTVHYCPLTLPPVLTA